jgi:hypothetical protein
MSNPVSSARRQIALIVVGVLLGTGCFFTGWFVARHDSIRIPSKTADASVPTAADAGSSVRASATEPTVKLSERTKKTEAASGWDDQQWQQTVAQPGSPARNVALADMLEKLAAVDPDRAMSLARTEGNLKLHELLLQSALHGWARTAPTNAAAWALALPDANERDRALSTVFAGAVAADPDAAMRFGKSLIQEHPDAAAGYGSSLIEALGAAGHFEIATRFAAEGDADVRSGWMGSAYSRWAEFQPDQAATAAAAIKDPDLRNEALHGIVGGWAEADPAALIQFVTALPADTDRSALLSQALERWAKHDPEAASAWINQNESGPELDQGVAAVATLDSVKPDLAVGWAESVTDPKLRSETLVAVIRNWLTTDLPAARQYFETTKNLLPADRDELSEVFTNFSHETAQH